VSQQDEATQEQQDKESRGEDNDNDGSVVSSFWHYFDSGSTRMTTTAMIMAFRNSFVLRM
jgi:hypothetical protein